MGNITDGKSAFSMKDDLKTTEAKAQELLDFIDSKTPQKTKYFKECQEFVKKNGYIISDNFFNSRTYFYAYDEWRALGMLSSNRRTKEQNSRWHKLNGELERFAQNNPIQNTGACMTKLAHILFDKWIEDNKLSDKVWVVNLIHDEIVSETKKELKEIVANSLQNCMIKAGNYFCKTIPMKVEPEITEFWKH